MSKRNLIFCGDIHGDFKKLVWTAIDKFKLENADIVVLGDFGVGFDNKIFADYERVANRLEERGIMIYTIRGNHDDPSWFDGSKDFPRLKFLKDYEIITLGDDQTILPIGGANSVDIEYRLKENEKLAKKKRACWWEGEDIERKKIKDIPKRVDIVISHECPILFSPIPSRREDCPLDQYSKILDSRNYLSKIAMEVNADYWFYGHYHSSYSGDFNELRWRCLDIMEFYQAPEKKQSNPQDDILETDESLIYEKNDSSI